MRKEIFAPICFRADGSVCSGKTHRFKSIAEEVLSLLLLTAFFLFVVVCVVLAPYGEETTSQVDTPGVGGPESVPRSEGSSAQEEGGAIRQSQFLRVDQLDGTETHSLWPVNGKLTDGFGCRRNPFGGYSPEFHAGQDISAPEGTPVVAAADGIVTFSGWQRGYGQIVIVEHAGQVATRYAHLSRRDVTAGQQISRSSQIGLVGSTGRSTGPHLHYEVLVDGQPVDPASYFSRRES